MTGEIKFAELVQSPSAVPGWPLKACVGLLCVGLLAVSLPLGVFGFGLLVYIFLILRVTVRPLPTVMQDDVIYAPVDGQIIAVQELKEGKKTVIMQPDLCDSHLHYAPVSGQIVSITWVDGSFNFNALDTVPDDARVRREISWKTKEGHDVELIQLGSRWCRLIQCFLREGRHTKVAGHAGLALFKGVVMVTFISSESLRIVPGQRCLAAQTPLGQAG